MKNDVLFQELADKIKILIPEEWVKVLLSAEVSEDACTVYFYYYISGDNEPIYSLDIEDKKAVNVTSFKKNLYEMENHLRSIWEDFKNKKGESFTQMTFVLDASGEFKAEYSYDELSENPVEQKRCWMKKYIS